MNHRFNTAALPLIALFLTGCSLWNPSLSPSDGAGNHTESLTETSLAELQAQGPIGLRAVWKTSVARSADTHQQHPGQIVVTDDALFVGSFQGHVVRLDRATGQILWESDAGEGVVGGVAVNRDRVFAGTRNGEMVAFAMADGLELWRASLSTAIASAPIVSGDTVLFVSLNNQTHALNSTTGQRLWSHATAPNALVVMGAPPPTVDAYKAYVGYASGEVFALSLKTGVPFWKQSLATMGGRTELDLLQDVDAGIVLPHATNSAPEDADKLFTVNHRGRAVALHALTGATLWETPLSAIRRPWLAHRRLIFADMDGYLVALNTQDGMSIWRTRLTTGLLTAPIALEEKLLVADDQGQLFALDTASGTVLGVDQVGETFLADPVVVGNSLFLWSNEGNLLRYDF